IRKAFEPLSNGSAPPLSTLPRLHPGIVVKEKKELGQVHVCLGVRGFPLAHEGRFQEYVLNTLLRGTMSSRLFQALREQRGLARQEVYFQRPFTLNEILEGIDRVRAEEVRALAEKMFDRSTCAVAVLGNTSEFRLTEDDLVF